MQDDTDQGKSSVFERLGRASVKPASALNRLSAPAQAAINSRQSSGAAATSSRPMDARDFLVASISNKARAGELQHLVLSEVVLV